MKSITVLFSIALCLAVIGPSYAKPSASADNQEHQNENQIRHRLKRQYPGFYGHHSQWPGYERRDDRDVLHQIYRLLEDISDYVRRPPPPPPPPQPIYIPYPIRYPGPRYCQCRYGSGSNSPNITTRWPEMEDNRQNWGYDDTDEVEEDYGVNARPINLDRIPSPSSTARTPPKVDHGTNQAAQSPRVDSTRRLQQCDSSVLSCCIPNSSRQQQQKCFAHSSCAEYFEKQDVCSTEHVQEVLDLITALYSPTKN